MQFYEGSCRMLEDRRVGGIPSVVTAHHGDEISVTHQLSGERETPRVTTSQPAARTCVLGLERLHKGSWSEFTPVARENGRLGDDFVEAESLDFMQVG